MAHNKVSIGKGWVGRWNCSSLVTGWLKLLQKFILYSTKR